MPRILKTTPLVSAALISGQIGGERFILWLTTLKSQSGQRAGGRVLGRGQPLWSPGGHKPCEHPGEREEGLIL